MILAFKIILSPIPFRSKSKENCLWAGVGETRFYSSATTFFLIPEQVMVSLTYQGSHCSNRLSLS